MLSVGHGVFIAPTNPQEQCYLHSHPRQEQSMVNQTGLAGFSDLQETKQKHKRRGQEGGALAKSCWGQGAWETAGIQGIGWGNNPEVDIINTVCIVKLSKNKR